MEKHATMHGPALYQLQVRGVLDASWRESMQVDTIVVQESSDHGSITVLTGSFRDQAALRGALDRLYRLNLPLISVQYISRQSRRERA